MEKNKSFDELVDTHGVGASDIYNIDLKLKFLIDNFNHVSNNTKIRFINLFNRIGKVEKDKGKDIYCFTEKDFKELFQSFRLSYGYFNSIKSVMKSYLKWCRYESLCDDNQTRVLEKIQIDHISRKEQMQKYYFRDLYDLDSVINQKVQILTEAQELNILTAKIVLYLAWVGVLLQDAVKIRKMDIDTHGKRIYIESYGSYINFDITSRGIFSEILDYSQIKWDGESIGKEDYILRTVEKNGEMLSTIKNMISLYFGANQRGQISNDRIINYQKVYYSGIFYRATKCYDQLSMKNPEFMAQIFKEDINKSSGYNLLYRRYRDFLTYCEYFYPEIYKIIKGYTQNKLV